MLVATSDDRINVCLAWNTIYQHIDKGIFDYETKSAALFLLSCGDKSYFVKVLAGGNIEFPNDVLFIASFLKQLDISKKGGLL